MTRVFFFRGQETGGGGERGAGKRVKKTLLLSTTGPRGNIFFVPDISIDMVLETRSI